MSFIPNIVNGKIVVNDSGIAGMSGRVVRFRDGSEGNFDAIVLCTGFKEDFSVLGDLAVEENNVRNLYKHFIHPDHGGKLALIGFVRPFSGGLPICAEMQARYFAQVCSGKLRLPDRLPELIEGEKQWEEYWTELSPRHRQATPSQTLYLDVLAKEIDCLMSVKDLVLHPRLLVRHWFYAFNQSCYRLVRPHPLWKIALEQMLNEELPGRSTRTIGRHIRLSLRPSSGHPKNRFLPVPSKTPAAPQG